MNKFVCLIWTVFLITGVCTGEDEGIPLVSGICLVENDVYKRGLPPGKLTIGLQLQEDALYKMSSQDRILDAGVFRKGFNSLVISAQDFFDRSDTHIFVLECKAGDWEVKKEIVIDIRLVPLYVVQKGGEERKKHEFTLSFFVGDRLIYATKKFALSDISFKIDLPPSDGQYDPFGLIDDIKKPPEGVSILGAVAMVYQIAKSFSPGKDEKDTDKDADIQKKQRIETTFLKTNITGDLWQWKALILLKNR